MKTPMSKSYIFTLIEKERYMQDKKWDRHPGYWPDSPWKKFAIVGEEVGEIANALLENDRENLIEELTQVAAVCVGWLEALHHDDYPTELPG